MDDDDLGFDSVAFEEKGGLGLTRVFVGYVEYL